MEEIKIRPYSQNDRDSVRQIAWDTAFFGGSAAVFFENKEVFTDFLTCYYIDYEPQSCFVAAAGDEVIGYLIGAKDTKAKRRGLFPKILFKAIKQGVFFRKKNLHFILSCLKSLMRGEFKSPDFSCEYPATMHINIKERFRSQGIGAKLITVYLDYLKKEKVKGLHLATLSEKAARFYEKLGFVLLHRAKRSYFDHIVSGPVYCNVYGKKLSIE